MTNSARFTLRLEPELKEWLEAEAERQDRSVAWLAKKAIAAMKDDQEAFDRAVDEAVAEAEDGVFVSGEAVHRWLESWGTESELPMPKPDIFLKHG